MEDAHLDFIEDDWAFFGVFDGHGGDACSAFVAKRLREELTADGCPEDDEAVKKLVFKIDKEFLDSDKTSGSTGTMCIVHKPKTAGDKHRLRVINIGDSRVVLGRRNGEIIDGGGTDEGLTTDHKPDNEIERARIYRTGGTVECKEGNCARVNGDLAVSRAFGDREYKKTGGPGPEDHPVTSDPEFGDFECDDSDFLLLVCDGVSEGDFPNPEVVKLVAKLLEEGKDPGEAAKAVCHEAVAKNSKDNISCMVVLFDGEEETHSRVFNPSSIQELQHKGFKSAYSAMASRADMTLAQAVEQRYELISEDEDPGDDFIEELTKIGKPGGEKGSAERTKWFEAWVQDMPEEEDKMEELLGMLGKGGAKGGGKGKGGAGKGGPSGYAAEPPPEPPREEKKEIVEMPEEEDPSGYSWNQNGEEIQVSFKLSEKATKKDIKVAFKASSIEVLAHGEKLLDGNLDGKVEVDECTWCLAQGGSELQVMLTKKDEAKWKTLLK